MFSQITCLCTLKGNGAGYYTLIETGLLISYNLKFQH